MEDSEKEDRFNLRRFVEAQDGVYEDVRSELRAGRKTSHWMWFIFPQVQGLGHSLVAVKFAISSHSEAEAFLRHPILGPRLRECTELVLRVQGCTAHEIFGSPDDMKFRSSMTLFARAAPQDPLFKEALQKYFEGKEERANAGAIVTLCPLGQLLRLRHELRSRNA